MTLPPSTPVAWQPKCPTPCDDDCEAPCHESHAVLWKKEHPDDWCQLSAAKRKTLNDLSRALHALPEPALTASTHSDDNAHTDGAS